MYIYIYIYREREYFSGGLGGILHAVGLASRGRDATTADATHQDGLGRSELSKVGTSWLSEISV